MNHIVKMLVVGENLVQLVQHGTPVQNIYNGKMLQ